MIVSAMNDLPGLEVTSDRLGFVLDCQSRPAESAG